MNIRRKALFGLALMTGAIIGSSVLGGSSAWADNWGHRGNFRGSYQNHGGYFGGYRPVRYGYGNPWRNQGGFGGYRGYGGGNWNPGGWNRGGWGNNRSSWGNRGWGGAPRWRRGFW